MPGLLVGGVGDRLLERALGAGDHGGGVGGHVGQVDDGVGVGRRHRGDARPPAPAPRPSRRGAWRSPSSVSTTAAPPSEVAQISSRCSGSATIGRGQHVVDRDRLLEPGVGVGQAVGGVLDLHLGEVARWWRRRGPCGDGRPGRSRWGWWRRRRRKRSQSGSVGAVAGVGGEEALGGGVGADHEGHVAQPGQDAGAGGLDGGDARGAGGVATTRRGRRSSRGLGERGARRRSRGSRCAWCRRRTRTARRSRRCRRRASASLGGGHAVLDEVAAPLAPRVHAHAEHGDLVAPAISSRLARLGRPASTSRSGGRCRRR